MFELPRGVTGFGVDDPPSVVADRREVFFGWVRAVAAALDSSVVMLPLGEQRSSFDAVRLERVDLWVLHNRFVPLVGALGSAPEPGVSWAVAGEYVDIDVAAHAAGWGPQVLSAKTLNGRLDAVDDSVGMGAKEQADRYKPEIVGHVIFNYWT